uniref:Helix-turn-helix XRE-family like protein n=1 Tax=Siphoviridae sp. ctP6113 TaxID=2826318 RepID=A0A8S5MTL7_9CAUD|nr:MAG TPA: helix-turn-helix XRE-family like protein [Siphoviridae sp. ctP6113]
MSRRVLSQLCGLSINVISMYERGERAPSVENLIRIADFFGVSVDFLLGRKKF